MDQGPWLAAVVVLVVAGPALAGCIGSGDAGPAETDPDPGTDVEEDPTQDNASKNTTEVDDSDDEDPQPRTPDDAMPGHDPVEAEPGRARYEITGTSQFAFKLRNGEVGPCGGTAPTGSHCSDAYNLTLQGDETRIEVLVQWDGERTDMHLVVRNPDGRRVANSVHGQVFLSETCEQVPGNCVFTWWPPNGTTWEYVSLPDGTSDLYEGDWTIQIDDENNWQQGHLTALAGQGEGVPYTLEVWVYTVPADPAHDPDASGS